jgi:hypothetical protein
MYLFEAAGNYASGFFKDLLYCDLGGSLIIQRVHGVQTTLPCTGVMILDLTWNSLVSVLGYHLARDSDNDRTVNWPVIVQHNIC